MRRILSVCVALLALAGCQGPGWAHVDEFGDATLIVTDHLDKYLQEDPKLNPEGESPEAKAAREERDNQLRTNELLRRYVEELRKR